MSEVKWIKLMTNVFENEKLLIIETLPNGDSIIVIWFKLLTEAGKRNTSGVFSKKTKVGVSYIRMLSVLLKRSESLIKESLEIFIELGMLTEDDDALYINNWGKYQSVDKLEKQNEYMRKYMRNYRDKQKESVIDKPKNKVNAKLNINGPDKDIDKDKEKEKEEDISNIDNNIPEVMEHNSQYGLVERLIIYNYLPGNKKMLTYFEGNLVIDWLKVYPYDYVENMIKQCSLQPESKRSMAYLKGAIEKGWEQYKSKTPGDVIKPEPEEQDLSKVFEELKNLKKGGTTR
jgi:predicted phage replisome organizer